MKLIIDSIPQLIGILLAFSVAIGAFGTFVEMLGNMFKTPGLVKFGQKLEALGTDIPELLKGTKASSIARTTTLVAFLVCAALLTSACAGWKPVVKDIDQAAIILCDIFFSEQPNAKGLSPADVEKAFCSSAEQVAPFLDSAKKAAGRGGAIRLAKVPQ